jgi:hypothetical protein
MGVSGGGSVPWVVTPTADGLVEYEADSGKIFAGGVETSLVSGGGKRLKLATVGDSYVQRWRNASGNTVDYQGKGVLTWALAGCGQAYSVVSDNAVGGAWVNQGGAVSPMITQADTAASSAADVVLVHGGLINSVVGGAVYADIYAAYVSILDKLASKTVILALQPGLDPSSTAYTAPRQALIAQVNRALRDLVAGSYASRNIRLVGLDLLYQPDPATGTWVSGFLNTTEADPKVHPSQPGAFAAGAVLAGVLGSITSYRWRPFEQPFISDNPLFLAGASTATGYTTAVTGTAAVTPTMVARSDGLGRAQRLTVTFGANNDSASLVSADKKAALVAGRRYRGVCRLTTSGSTNLRTVRVQLILTGASATLAANWCQLDNDSDPDAVLTQELNDLPAMTEPFTYDPAVTGAVTSLQMIVRAFGAGAGGTTLDVSMEFIEEAPAA